MHKVDVWIWTDSRYAKESKKCYAYSVEGTFRGRPYRKYGKIEEENPVDATYNKITLLAIAEALERFHKNAEVTIHCENGWVLDMIDNRLMLWEGSDFYNSRNSKIENEAEWRRIAVKAHSLKLVTDRVGFDRCELLAKHAFAEE